MLEVRLPETQVARFQTLEYIRSFLLGRLAWSKLNGLLLISGAFGLFDKDVVINAGGYNINTVGEDMELVVRMRAHMHRKIGSIKLFIYLNPFAGQKRLLTMQYLDVNVTVGHVELLRH